MREHLARIEALEISLQQVLQRVAALEHQSERREAVRELAAQGESTRAIAEVVGVDHSTVVRDIAGANAPESSAAAAQRTDIPGDTGANAPAPPHNHRAQGTSENLAVLVRIGYLEQFAAEAAELIKWAFHRISALEAPRTKRLKSIATVNAARRAKRKALLKTVTYILRSRPDQTAKEIGKYLVEIEGIKERDLPSERTVSRLAKSARQTIREAVVIGDVSATPEVSLAPSIQENAS